MWPIRIVFAVIAVMAIVRIGFEFAPTVAGLTLDARTDAASDTLNCTTAAAATSCTVILTSAHQNFDLTGATVTETSPGSGDHTDDSSLDADGRRIITVSGLTAATSYSFSVSYLAEQSGLTDLQSFLYTWAPLGMLGAFLVFAILVGASFLGIFERRSAA